VPSSISIKPVVTHITIGDALSFPIVSARVTEGERGNVRTFGFAFPDSQGGEKTKLHTESDALAF
jgi:hypothetical protein